MKITKEQAEIYQILFNMIMKFIFAIVVLAVFVLVISKLLFDPNLKEWSQTVPLASLDVMLAATLFVAFRHYFPNRDKSE